MKRLSDYTVEELEEELDRRDSSYRNYLNRYSSRELRDEIEHKKKRSGGKQVEIVLTHGPTPLSIESAEARLEDDKLYLTVNKISRSGTVDGVIFKGISVRLSNSVLVMKGDKLDMDMDIL